MVVMYTILILINQSSFHTKIYDLKIFLSYLNTNYFNILSINSSFVTLYLHRLTAAIAVV